MIKWLVDILKGLMDILDPFYKPERLKNESDISEFYWLQPNKYRAGYWPWSEEDVRKYGKR